MKYFLKSIFIVLFYISVINSYSQVSNDYYRKIINKVKEEGTYAEYRSTNGKLYSGYVLYLYNTGLWLHLNFPGKRIIDSFYFIDETDIDDIDITFFRGYFEMGTNNTYLEQTGVDKSNNYWQVKPRLENIKDIIIIFLESKSEKRTYSQAAEAIKRAVEGGLLDFK